MGCLCCKPYAIDDSNGNPGVRSSNKASYDNLEVTNSVSSRREENYGSKRRLDNNCNDSGNEGKVIVIDKQVNGLGQLQSENSEWKREKADYVSKVLHPWAGMVPRANEREQVAAGWPHWLVAAAGEAIKGWVPRRADSFEKLDKIGQGTYSNVYRARDLDGGKIVALKKVRFDNMEPESVRFMAREIHILRRLDHPNIIKLEGLVTSRMSCSLYLVFEYMEHDMAGLASRPELKFTEPQVKCYVQQLLLGLDHCHSRGILHRDIKGSNLLIDKNGVLKIADFGLASFYDPHLSQPLTSRVVTLWYRPPELLLGATYYGVAVDLWSTGCIVAELYAGRPIMPGRTEVEQLHKIFKLCGSPSEEYWKKSKLPHTTIFKPQQPYKRRIVETFKDFPEPALALIEILLSIDPTDRGSAASALKNEFFTARPHPCDPSSLPKYPPTKEFDVKIREEARRLAPAGSKGLRQDVEKRGSRESRAIPAPEANAELILSMQKRRSQSSSRSRSEMFSSHPEEAASGFPIEPPRPSHSAEQSNEPLVHGTHSGPAANRAKSWKPIEDDLKGEAMADFTAVPSIAARRSMMFSGEQGEKMPHSGPDFSKLISTFPGSFKEVANGKMRRDKKNADFQPCEDERASQDPVLLGYGSKCKKIHYSGPLLVPSGKVEQALKDHDRQVQEAVRRARLDKARLHKMQGDGNKFSINSLFVSGR